MALEAKKEVVKSYVKSYIENVNSKSKGKTDSSELIIIDAEEFTDMIIKILSQAICLTFLYQYCR